MVLQITQKVLAAENVILTTHRHCDGDGLGAEISVYHALCALGKSVRILHLDPPPKKYGFLKATHLIEIYQGAERFSARDVAIVFDTNDERLVEPLYSAFKEAQVQTIFIDHHPPLRHGPKATPGSWIDANYASTGEMAYHFIKALGVELNTDMARALYTSVVFDTQLFRFIKSDPRSHLMAADLLRFAIQPEEIHRALFATYTTEKMAFMARALSLVEYHCDKQLAIVILDAGELAEIGVEKEETGDVIDLIMNIDSVQVAALVRKDGEDALKISLRSKGSVAVLPLAEALGGGGHHFAAGAYLKGSANDLASLIVERLSGMVAQVFKKTGSGP